ncbi:MAG: hypothetical protein ACE5GY_04135 [Thermodesulfobacteriota bacterium]
MRNALFILLCSVSLMVPSTVWAEPPGCEDHGILQDMDHYTEKWAWGGPRNRADINLWDSPAHIAIVGSVLPGAYVDIIGEKDGYYRIRTPESQGSVTGWIKEEQVESIIPREESRPYECGYKASQHRHFPLTKNFL